VPNDAPDYGRATAGQLRRAGFEVDPANTDDSATTGFEILTNHGDERAQAEFAKATKRGDHMPKAAS
jgi:uroporphyrinogen-III synthase